MTEKKEKKSRYKQLIRETKPIFSPPDPLVDHAPRAHQHMHARSSESSPPHSNMTTLIAAVDEVKTPDDQTAAKPNTVDCRDALSPRRSTRTQKQTSMPQTPVPPSNASRPISKTRLASLTKGRKAGPRTIPTINVRVSSDHPGTNPRIYQNFPKIVPIVGLVHAYGQADDLPPYKCLVYINGVHINDVKQSFMAVVGDYAEMHLVRVVEKQPEDAALDGNKKDGD